MAFRGLTAAAPLKPVARLRTRREKLTFRGLTAAAPLKRDHPAELASRARSGGFPRPHRRGPIEATIARKPPTASPAFRGLTAAAPLKP